jgi:hypothetical protein
MPAVIGQQHDQPQRIGFQYAGQERIEVGMQLQRVLKADVQKPVLGQAEVGGSRGRRGAQPFPVED